MIKTKRKKKKSSFVDIAHVFILERKMFDKLKYNNLLISGSKEIQKAKIQVLRKVIQKIQKLKKTLERRPDDESCKIKLRKCLAIVESAKKIKKFEALTNILLLEKCPTKIVTNSNSTPEEVVLAMLATNQTMKIFLTKIRQELNLNETDLPTWRKTLIQISKQKVKTQHRKKKKQALEAAAPAAKKKTKLKQRSKKENDTSFSENKNVSKPTPANTQMESEEVISVNENEISKVKPKNNASKSSIANAKIQSKEIFTNEPLVSKVDGETETAKVKSKPKKAKASKTKLEPLVKTNYTAENSSNEIEPKKSKKSESQNVFKTNEASGNFASLSTSFKPMPKSRQPEVKFTTVVDPFFTTETGENYVAIAPVFEANNEVTNNNLSAKETKKLSDEKFKTFNFEYKKVHSSWVKETNKVSNGKSRTFKPENEQLHPSWAAKQRQRVTIGSFQGKRKVFDDDAADGGQKTLSKGTAADMHPSWLAKQKLKPTITAFQGKKITFEDA